MPAASGSDPRKRSLRQVQDDNDEPSQVKRQRHSGSSAQGLELEEVDLTTGNDIAQAMLKKEREDLVTSQKPDDDSAPKSFGEMTCIICMDNFTDLTATPCGEFSTMSNSNSLR
ncbi:hypothetical protein K461DRAFT_58020 [Myriangium duriaei CBS 260.36]|uniref:Uncharacterized protein n=1 Tax=Myriangium duriaei CBS 260.36 TaxID=1168546 RepID=A0A9P4IR63_9PEZI|nr:hypothetical protein K461DRAFT_58020 [Myriangium duriaei CBS 260.36]